MVKVKFTTEDGLLKFKASGHANYGQYGSDIVCSAITILAYTLAESVNDAKKCEYLSHPPSIMISDGLIVIDCLPLSEQYDRMLTVFNTIKSGYKVLTANYPENITLDDSGFSQSK